MDRRTRQIESARTGLVFGLGMLLLFASGGPCGPTGWVGTAVFYVTIVPTEFFLGLIPGVERSPIVPFLLVILCPAFLWAVLEFSILTVWSKLKKGAATPTDSNAITQDPTPANTTNTSVTDTQANRPDTDKGE